MKAKDVRELSDEELAAKERELTESTVVLRLRLRTNQLENSASLGATRRDIARVKTIRNERQRRAQG